MPDERGGPPPPEPAERKGNPERFDRLFAFLGTFSGAVLG